MSLLEAPNQVVENNSAGTPGVEGDLIYFQMWRQEGTIDPAMMTSSHGNVFRITDCLWGDSTCSQ